MISRNITSILIGLLLAIFDMFNMSAMKSITINRAPRMLMLLVTALYAVQPWIFIKGLNFTSMTVLNLSWDLLSDILVTLSGLLYFRESLTEYKLLGVLFALVAIILFAVDGSADS
jgi:EamA domain-containing membrane protein RarD